ncbi:hypothetical protein H696_02259 [Fonticula alba]|uniref:RRM domain-containing protein n=1 Tax=Fonticula alba TaxID=691883 RepID=A0A058ZBL6_FONAL|nr:hypothetical protein H696_02259 [Fonticula alba]KCV71313.1 hypothetical protein H696_02259 [Fonticula alba]|eukprot:XP_009494436.1 hypothetical protein H696_02259 [Fonticula alba]
MTHPDQPEAMPEASAAEAVQPPATLEETPATATATATAATPSTAEDIEEQSKMDAAAATSTSSTSPGKPADPEANLIINYIPNNVDEAHLSELFNRYGTPISVRVIRNTDNNESLGYGFVRYADRNEAQAAIRDLNGHKIGDKSLRVAVSRPRTNNNLYVAGLDPETTREDLFKLFSQFGQVTDVKILVNPNSGISRGVAFVRFDNDQGARKAIDSLDGSPTRSDRVLTVRVADSPSSSSRGPQRSAGGRATSGPADTMVSRNHPAGTHRHPGQDHSRHGTMAGLNGPAGPIPHGALAGAPAGPGGGHAHPLTHLHVGPGLVAAHHHPHAHHPHHLGHHPHHPHLAHHPHAHLSHAGVLLAPAGAGNPPAAVAARFAQVVPAGAQVLFAPHPGAGAAAAPAAPGSPMHMDHHPGASGPWPGFHSYTPVHYGHIHATPPQFHQHSGPGGPGAGSAAVAGAGAASNGTPTAVPVPMGPHHRLVPMHAAPGAVLAPGIPTAATVASGAMAGQGPGNGSNGSSTNTGSISHPKHLTLFVYDIPASMDNDQLLELFAAHGKNISAQVTRDPATGKSRGFGFVYFQSVSEAQQAIDQLDGFVLDTKKLQVSFRR